MRSFPPHSVTITNLACQRGERLLFRNLSATIEPGQLLALRGPNGAGKTSLLMALAGMLRPEAGSIVIERPDPDVPVGETLAFLAYQPGLKGRLTVAENLKFWTALFGTRSDIPAALERVGLGALSDLAVHNLSAGQTRRLALARLILSDRPIWLLDEPVAALDADGEILVGQLVMDHLDRGGLVIAATHRDLKVDLARTKTLQLGTVPA